MRWAVLAVVLAFAPVARAQPDASIAAQALFDDAKALMDQGRYADACPKLEESQRLEPAGGTLLHLALCYEGARRFGSAWASFKEALSVAVRDRREDRAKVAREHLADIEPRLSRLTVVVPPELARTEGLKVTRNDVLLGRAQWGAPVPIDAGRVTVEASAPGKQLWRQEIEVAEATSLRVAIPTLADEARAAPPMSRPPPSREAPAEGLHPQAVAGWVLIATGLAAGVAGGALGGAALAKKNQAEPQCDENNFCSDEAIAWQEEGIVMGNASTGLFVAGGVLAATGLVVLLTAPKRIAGSAGWRMPWRLTW